MNGLQIREKRKKLGLTQLELAEQLGVSKNTVLNYEKGSVIPESKITILNKILNNEKPLSQEKNLIPYYEDVDTIGGSNVVAETEAIYKTDVQIDAGDWFKGATAAIRHYENSMIEYPSGCILAIKELKNKDEIIWGRNYVIETTEMRITKKIAELDDEYICCHSTNTETYPDNSLIHQPIKVKKKDIRYIARVLGSVNKEESTGKIQIL